MSSQNEPGVIQVEGGLVSGVIDEKSDVLIFKGIPYAAPPVGNLRWCPPQPVLPWEGVRKCDKFEKICPQRFKPEGTFFKIEFYDHPDPETSEDCLYLNIWLPKSQINNKSSPIPVSFYIHGGGFGCGWGHEKEFDGESFSKKNVILITINYRVSVFGFLAHPLLLQHDSTNQSQSSAILDILKALKWVKQYISNFGGDPNKITVFGQSAGSSLSATLSVIDETKSMFNNVILQSGVAYKNQPFYYRSLEESLKIGEEFFEPFKVKSVQDMQNIKVEDLLERNDEMFKIYGVKRLSFVPMIDGKIIKKSFEELVNEGKFHPENIIIGWNKEDMFLDIMKTSVIEFSKALSKQNKNVYTYFFSPDIPGGDNAGAFHSCELWYMFGTLKKCWRPFDKKDFDLSEKMVSCWCNFCKTGNPNEEGHNEWPKFKDGQKIIEFDYDITLVESLKF